jgi:hypothetical protein
MAVGIAERLEMIGVQQEQSAERSAALAGDQGLS